jgi:hypothetical protein
MDATSEDNRALSAPDTATEFVLIRTRATADVDVVSGVATSRGTPAALAPIYRLDDMSDVQMSPHVGQEVEISGAVIDEERHESAGAATMLPPPKVVVSALTMIASHCTNVP